MSSGIVLAELIPRLIALIEFLKDSSGGLRRKELIPRIVFELFTLLRIAWNLARRFPIGSSLPIGGISELGTCKRHVI
ncbi:MAG: hypothetical protein ACFFCQ_12245 [Promethearchaeota archaeon]